MAYSDSGHRPHARHTGERAKNPIFNAPHHLNVTLDTWGPVDNLFPALYDALQSNWGENPSRAMDRYCDFLVNPDNPLDDEVMRHRTGECKMSIEEMAYIESCFAGKTLPQVLERITFSFLIDGCTRASTHQLVRTRLGAAFMQHGGRDNDWRHRPWVMPETIRRACAAYKTNMREGEVEEITGRELRHCITSWKPIDQLMSDWDDSLIDGSLYNAIEQYLSLGRQLYSALVDAGIPWEDARRLLWMGTSTYIHADYNYLGLQGVMARRLEHVMDWEINCIVQLMKREVAMKCPPVFAKYLVSMSDKLGRAAFAGLESWTPDGKYPNPHERCKVCGHSLSNHAPSPEGCETCFREGPDAKVDPIHEYDGLDTLPREHRAEQNPYFVLTPEAMAGGPVEWIPTNGVYPWEKIHALQESGEK